MLSKIDKENIKLEEEKKKVQAKIKSKESILKSKEKKILFNHLVEIGKIAKKANIHEVESLVLLGAFLEISESISEPDKLENWRKKGVELQENFLESSRSPLTIKFKQEPVKETVKKLKEINFKWNRFRKEFYGYGNKKEVQETFKNENCIIEEIK